MHHAVCALVTKFMWDKELVLCVSRKDNPDDFGLPGGKVENGERLIEALKRELEEETGIVLHPEYPPRSLYMAAEGDTTVYTFLCLPPSKQRIQSKETGIIKWMTWDELCSQGSFKDYNIQVRKMYEALIKDNTASSPI